MNIVCVICSDLFIPSDDIFYTPCGHIFHFACLTQWLERSKSCPQCREKTNNHKIHRIYFNFSNNDTIVEDASSLQDKIDKLNFQLLLKSKDIKQCTEKNETLEKQNAGLRKEVRKVESELNEKNTAIHALKEQAKYFKQQCSEVEGAREEIVRLKKKVDEYKNIQTLLEFPAEEVDEMISRTRDASTLVTYITVMKREMTISLNKRRELRSKVKSLQQELTKVSMERNFLSEEHAKRKKLEEELMVCESEKMFLQNKIRDLEGTVPVLKKPRSNISSKIDKVVSTIVIDEPSDYITNTLGEEAKCQSKETAEKKDHNSAVIVIPDGENSPYLPVKSQGVFALKEHSQRRTNTTLGHSILAKKPRLNRENLGKAKSSMITYDGFGGHSKYDQFPNPIFGAKAKKTRDEVVKSKKTKLDTGDNQKLGNQNFFENQATFYPASLMSPFMRAYPPKKLDSSLYGGEAVSYFQNYRNEALSKFSSAGSTIRMGITRQISRDFAMPSNNISTIDAVRMKEVDDFFKGVQVHRNQYKDHTGSLHPLAFFRPDNYKYQCAPGTTFSYFSKYPEYYTEYKVPPVLPLTYSRKKQTPYIPDLSLSGVYSPYGCIAYKR
ncbi:hypothetical protein KM043_010101 [Ampulex compressa]|nr:hypothetical protein KM043_010101 [Ampulex compressa]